MTEWLLVILVAITAHKPLQNLEAQSNNHSVMLTDSVSREFVQQDLLISASQPPRPQLEKTGWSGGEGWGVGGRLD